MSYQRPDINSVDWDKKDQIHKCAKCGSLKVLNPTESVDIEKANDCRKHRSANYQIDLMSRDLPRTTYAESFFNA